MSRETEVALQKGDCLPILANIESNSIDLVYLDPPFFTQKVHRLSTRDGEREFFFEDMWASEREYYEFICKRLRELHRVLGPSGSIFFHCDRNATHIARLLLDRVFGKDNFRSEIVWRYRRWTNSRKGLLPTHQTIYYYTKSDQYVFNQVWEHYSPSTNVDQILQRRMRDVHGRTVYQRDALGDVVVNGAKKGVPLGDVWDIPYLNPKAKERTGYPTQKPLLLLERIINLSTNEGARVLDPFCGSGTTLVAAKLLGRNAIGIDTSDDAIELTSNRLADPIKTESRLLQAGRESYETADKSALRLLQGLDYVAVHRNKGIDAILKQDVDGKPIPIRVQREHESVQEAAQKLYKASRTKNVGTMFLIVTNEYNSLQLLSENIPDDIVTIHAPASIISQFLAEQSKK